MLKARVLTALILLAIVLPALFLGTPGQFGLVVAVAVVLGAWEWARLLGLPLAGSVPYALVALAGVAVSYAGMIPSSAWLRPAVLFWLLIGPYTLWRKPQNSGAWRVFLLLAGWVVLIAAWQAIWLARLHGVIFLLSVMVVVWLADSGAYFAGKAFGRHKLAPSISPGKTWEGAAGGWLLVLLVAAVVMLANGHGAPTLVSVLVDRFGVAIGAVCLTMLVIYSIVGDLFESQLKRQAGRKDSSGLLPGHGGVLDRIDALLPVLPLVMLLV